MGGASIISHLTDEIDCFENDDEIDDDVYFNPPAELEPDWPNMSQEDDDQQLVDTFLAIASSYSTMAADEESSDCKSVCFADEAVSQSMPCSRSGQQQQQGQKMKSCLRNSKKY